MTDSVLPLLRAAENKMLIESHGIYSLIDSVSKGKSLLIAGASTEKIAQILSGLEYLAHEGPRTRKIWLKRTALRALRQFDPQSTSSYGPLAGTLIRFGQQNTISLDKYRKQLSVYYTHLQRSQVVSEPLSSSLSQLAAAIVFATRNMYANLVDEKD